MAGGRSRRQRPQRIIPVSDYPILGYSSGGTRRSERQFEKAMRAMTQTVELAAYFEHGQGLGRSPGQGRRGRKGAMRASRRRAMSPGTSARIGTSVVTIAQRHVRLRPAAKMISRQRSV